LAATPPCWGSTGRGNRPCCIMFAQ
jgi:hypothetical protein